MDPRTDLKPHIHFGAGQIRVLPKILADHGVRSILLISGNHAFAGSGAEHVIGPLSRTMQVHRFSEFTPNPKMDEIECAVRRLGDVQCDAVVAIGGGTALDIAKAAAVLAAQESSPADCLGGGRPLRLRSHLLVLVPTTAGSGSEVTSFSVVYVKGIKRSLDDPALIADHAVIDPDLTSNLPRPIAASASLDTLSQAIESLWSVRSTESSRRDARQALRLTLDHIEAFCTCPGPGSRTAMARAALLAGRAINVTRTTGPHAVSYTLTTLFGISHGHACALTLPAFLVYNAQVNHRDTMDPRGAEWVRQRIREILALLGTQCPEAGSATLRRLVQRTGLEPRLSGLGLGPHSVELVLDQGFDPQRAGNNPRRLTRDGLCEILTNSL